MRALIYARVSVDARGGRSVAEQEAECRAWAAREGWDVVDVITETGSASSFARSTGARSQWGAITSAVTSGRIDVLLTWEASRATRRLAEYAELADLCAENGVLWGYSGVVHDLSTRDARFRTGLDALLAQDESARTSERLLRSVRSRAVAGAPHGKLPYGYRREYDSGTGALIRQVPDEETAPIVREIVRRVITGDTLRAIARDLDSRGVPPPRPPRSRHHSGWLSSTVRRLAISPTHAGLRTHRGEIVGDAAWPAIVSRDDHERAVAILTDPARAKTSGDSTARWLLSGIATCGRCGAPMRVLINRGRPSYSCSPQGGCMRITRVVSKVDPYVEQVVLDLATDLARRSPDTTTDTPALADARAELAALEQRLHGFIDAAADGDLSPTALARVEGRLRPQIRAARARITALARPSNVDPAVFDDPSDWWDAAPIADRRSLVRELVAVRILPAGRGRRTFDPETVEVTPLW